MSVGASAVRQDEFLTKITNPSKTDNVPIKQSRVEGLYTPRAVLAHHAGQGELWLQPTTEKLDPLLGQTMFSEVNDTIS